MIASRWFKFGGVEFFKVNAAQSLGPAKAWENKTAIYLGASAAAEFIADLFLCPLEAVRIRAVSDSTFPKGLLPGAARMLSTDGLLGFYAGLGPILFKQVSAVRACVVFKFSHFSCSFSLHMCRCKCDYVRYEYCYTVRGVSFLLLVDCPLLTPPQVPYTMAEYKLTVFSCYLWLISLQVPYTMAKFAVQGNVAESIYGKIGQPNTQTSGTNLSVSLGSGVVAGAIPVSPPLYFSRFR